MGSLDYLLAVSQIAVALGLRELTGWAVKRRYSSLRMDAAKTDQARMALQHQLLEESRTEISRLREQFGQDTADLKDQVQRCEQDRQLLHKEIVLLTRRVRRIENGSRG